MKLIKKLLGSLAGVGCLSASASALALDTTLTYDATVALGPNGVPVAVGQITFTRVGDPLDPDLCHYRYRWENGASHLLPLDSTTTRRAVHCP